MMKAAAVSDVRRPADRLRRCRATLAAAACVYACAPLSLAAAFDAETCNRDAMPKEDVRACTEAIYAPGTTMQERIRIYTLRGVAWMREDEPLAAVADFTRAIALDASNIAALKGRARAYSSLGKHDAAAMDWSAIITLNPHQTENFNERGSSWLAAGQLQNALDDFTRATQLDPASAQAYVGRAGVYDRMNDRPRAIAEFDLAVGAAPARWTTYLARAEIADRWGDRQMAIDNYRLVIKHNHRHWNSYKALHRLGADSYFGQEQ